MSSGPLEPGAPAVPSADASFRAPEPGASAVLPMPAGVLPGTSTGGELITQPVQGLHWRTSLLLASAFVTVLVASLTLLFPVPYVVLEPGPAINTLGKDGGHSLITVTGRATYPAKGALDLTTVTVSGGPDTRLSVYHLLGGWFDDARALVPLDVMYPPGETVERSRQENQQEMVTSQESATVAALQELGIRVPATLTIHSVDPGTPPSTLKPRDVLVAVNGRPIVDLDGLSDILSGVEPGAVVSVTVRRDGRQIVVGTPTRRWEDGRTILGIRVDPTFHPPFQVTIRIDNVGGPSAGTMFALGIIDLLTPGDLTGGKNIAGTGTIEASGEVGPIGGIQQKLVGARRAGATWFLAPSGNCDEVAGHVPDGMRVVAVDNLRAAHRAVQQIAAGRDLGSLPACTG